MEITRSEEEKRDDGEETPALMDVDHGCSAALIIAKKMCVCGCDR